MLSEALATLGVGPVRWAVEQAHLVRAQATVILGEDGRHLLSARGVETELLSLLLQLKQERPTDDLVVSDALQSDVRALARDGAPAVAVLDGVRRLHLCVQDALCTMVNPAGGGRSDVDVARAWRDLKLLARYSEVAARVLLTAFEDERPAWPVDHRSRRQELVGRLVRGDRLDAGEELALGVRLTGMHLVAVAAGAGGGVPADPDDQRIADFRSTVSGLLAGCAVITAPVDEQVLIWWARPRGFDAHELDALARVPAVPGLRIAFGDPHRGPHGLARGYVEATRALTVVDAHETEAGEGSPVRRHAQALLAAAVVADRAAAQDLVGRELAGVLGRDQRSRDLRRTVLCFLRSGGSRQAAAEELGIAPTTVAYRIERFERLRGARLQESRLDVWVALHVVDLLPSLLAMPAVRRRESRLLTGSGE